MKIKSVKILSRYIKRISMHEKIARIQKEEKHIAKDLKSLKKADIKQDRKLEKKEHKHKHKK